MTENDVKRSVMNDLLTRGFTVIRVNAGAVKVRGGYAHLADKGTPDVLAISPAGVHCWFEIKRPGGKLRDEQIAWMAEHGKRGVNVAVVESVDEVRHWLTLWSA